MPGNYW